jgi:uncharacterized protein (UPF0332 family)
LFGRFGEHLVKTGVLPRALGTPLTRTLELRQKADYGSGEVAHADAEHSLSEPKRSWRASSACIGGYAARTSSLIGPSPRPWMNCST